MNTQQMKRMGFSLLIPLLLAGCSLNGTEPVISGTIEAEELPIVAEVGGKIQKVNVEEGDPLAAGATLAEIDKRTYQLSIDEAEAAVLQAAAKLEEARAGTRNQTVQKGIAAVQQASANIQLYEAKNQQAAANVSKAQEQLTQIESQLAGAKRTLQYQQDRMQEVTQLFESGAISKRDRDTQQEQVNLAQTQVNQLTAQVAATRAQLLVAKEDQAAANAQIGTAKASWDSAAAELNLLQEGSTDYQIKQLIAAEKQARVKLDQAKLQLEKATLIAPEAGVLLRKNVTEGEVAKVGATLFTMMKKDQLKVKVYIPEANLGQVKVGKKVTMQVDAYPGESFDGVIRTIADRAEFTPKNVQTKDERTKLVFAVTVEIKSGLDKLKPGMPVDVWLSREEGAK